LRLPYADATQYKYRAEQTGRDSSKCVFHFACV
jgi:hypothetical protein